MKETDVQQLIIVIENLLRVYPEIAEDEVLRADMLDGETTISDVVTELIRLREDARAMHEGTKEQIARLKARQDRFDRRMDFARDFIAAILNAADLRKLELPEGTVYLKANQPQVVGDLDPAKLPDDLVKIERKADKTKIKDALKAGRVIEGVQLSNAAPSLVITVR